MATGLDNCGLRELAVRGDERGNLVALEGRTDAPFDIARVYYLFGTGAGVSRGHHAHLALRQMAVCVAGSCVMVFDNGREKRSVRLDRPNAAVLIPPMIWHEMHDFTPDCVLLVLADAAYDEADYIRGYDDFIARVADGAAR